MQAQLQKVIIISIVFLLVIGGALVWFFLRSSPPTESNNPQTQYGNTGGNNQTTVIVPSQGQSQAQSSLDIQAAYRDLFQKIIAQRVVFISTNATSTGPAGTLYGLYADDIKESKKLYPSAPDFSIKVAFVDITDDGIKEALVYEDLPGFCGSGGCSLDIFQQKQTKWTKLSSLSGGEEVGLSNTLTNGYLDLFLTEEDAVVRYVWDGKEYQPGETMAIWDGTTFKLAQ